MYTLTTGWFVTMVIFTILGILFALMIGGFVIEDRTNIKEWFVQSRIKKSFWKKVANYKRELMPKGLHDLLILLKSEANINPNIDIRVVRESTEGEGGYYCIRLNPSDQQHFTVKYGDDDWSRLSLDVYFTEDERKYLNTFLNKLKVAHDTAVVKMREADTNLNKKKEILRSL